MELRSNRNGQRGFSLLEVMIALAILGFGLAVASLGQLAAMKNSRGTRGQMDALYLAQQQIEIFQSMSGTDVVAAISDPNYPDDPNSPVDPDPGDDDSASYARRWFIVDDDPEVGTISIRVEVDYRDRIGISRTVALRTLKADL